MKKVGIDISPLQGPHRMRGIGYVTQHIINHLPKDSFGDTELVLFYGKNLDIDITETLKNLRLEGISYSLRKITGAHESIFEKRLPGRLALIPKAFTKLSTYFQYRYGTTTFGYTRDINTFIQFDQNAPLPRRLARGGKGLIVIYDIIPYKLEADYLWRYSTARRRGLNRRAALKCSVRRLLYKYHLIANTRHASRLISISDATTNDFVFHIGVRREKIEIVKLGVPEHQAQAKKTSSSISLARFYDTSWGYLPQQFTFSSSRRFLLFVGGADHRRKLEDLVAAFNQLNAQGQEILLVLAGDSMQGPNNISNDTVRRTLISTAYPERIIYVGFTDDNTRDWLYEHATAFVFPSVYEGFGLPVLEAMSYGTPVISYDNLATKEVALDGPLYASDVPTLIEQIRHILGMSKYERKTLSENSIAISKRYTWKAAGEEFQSIING